MQQRSIFGTAAMITIPSMMIVTFLLDPSQSPTTESSFPTNLLLPLVLLLRGPKQLPQHRTRLRATSTATPSSGYLPSSTYTWTSAVPGNDHQVTPAPALPLRPTFAHPAPPRDFGCLPHPAIPGRISLLFPPTLQHMQSPRQRKNHGARRAHSELCWVPVRTYRMGGLACGYPKYAHPAFAICYNIMGAQTHPQSRAAPRCAFQPIPPSVGIATLPREIRREGEDERTDAAHLQ
ncbi:hypothetical protein B0H14DRAFT_3606963 [Mycena olivaceomarginata]|nr:hypothetical protein B0H14DRAFT_3606963 [Mycena olivaceomarginata]